MNFDELFVGLSYSMSKSFTTEEVNIFSTLSMDNNPIHLNEDYASKSFFGDRIVHGFLSASLFSAIIGTKMPGNGSIYINQTMNFKKPIYHGQYVNAVVTITSINKEKRLVSLETQCLDVNGNILIDGNALVKLI